MTNVLVSTVASYNLIGHTGCCYDYMTKNTCTIINYHVQYLTLDAQRKSSLLCISNRQYKDN